jgi:hypothetical protein
VRYVVSDRAKALIQLAVKGLKCLSMPDFFHLVHDIVKSYSLALGQRLKQARQELQKAEDRLRRSPDGATRGEAYREATHQVEVRHAEVRHWEARHQEYRQQLETLSLTLHPFAIDDAALQTSAQVEARLQAHVEAIEAFAHASQLPARQAAMTKVKKTAACRGGSRRFLVARRAPGFGARRRVSSLAAVGARGITAAEVLGASSHPHTLRPEESQDAAGIGAGPRRV